MPSLPELHSHWTAEMGTATSLIAADAFGKEPFPVIFTDIPNTSEIFIKKLH